MPIQKNINFEKKTDVFYFVNTEKHQWKKHVQFVIDKLQFGK